MLKSTKDEQIRQQTEQDIAKHRDQPDAISYFEDMERVSRLRSDSIATPLYALALLEVIADTPSKLSTASRLFKARSYFSSSQAEIARYLLPLLGTDLPLLTEYCDMVRGSINVEKYYVTAEIQRMQLLPPEEAAQAAEKLSSETAMQVPFEERMRCVYTQLDIISRIHDNVRILLAGQKFRIESFQTFLADSKTTPEQRKLAHTWREKICRVLYTALIEEGRYAEAQKFIIWRVESLELVGDAHTLASVLELALVTAFIISAHDETLKTGYFDESCSVAKREVQDLMHNNTLLLADVIRSTQIQNYAMLRDVDFSFLPFANLTQQIKAGFVKLYFDKIYRIFERITLKRISELIGVENIDVEKILIQQSYNIRIDRTSGEVVIGQTNGDQRYMEMSSNVQNILWSVAECSYLLGSKQ